MLEKKYKYIFCFQRKKDVFCISGLEKAQKLLMLTYSLISISAGLE